MTLPIYTTQKLSRSRVAIFRDGEYLCQLMPREVAGWIARAERSARADAELAVEQRERRLTAIREYLIRRASRPAPPQQLTLL